MNDQPRSLKTYLLLGVVFAIAFSGYEAWNQSQAADEVEATPVASAAPGRMLKIRCRGTAFAASIVGTIDGAAGPHVVPANTTVELHSDGAGWYIL